MADLVFVAANDSLVEAIQGDKRCYVTFTVETTPPQTFIVVPNSHNEKERFRMLYSTFGSWRFEKNSVYRLIDDEIRRITSGEP